HRGAAKRRARGDGRREAERRRRALGRWRESRQGVRGVSSQLLVPGRGRRVLPHASAPPGGASQMTLASMRAIAVALAVMASAAMAEGGQAPPAKPRMVEDVFKNVQALKGIGVDDFLLTMGIMSAAVGSDCVGCHPSAGTDHVDWALDTPRKRTARRMVQMV